MMTPTHLLLSCGLLTRKHSALNNWAVVAGGVLPDSPMYVLFPWDRFVLGLPEETIWSQRYWTDTWQIPVAIGHSMPLFAAVLAVGLALRSDWLKLFGLSALIHAVADFFTHNDDAHMQLWPLTRWKFISPVSYYDPAHYGGIVSILEFVLMIVMLAVLWRRFDARWVKVATGLALLAAVAVPAYFMLTHQEM